MLCTGLQFSKLYDRESLIKKKKKMKWFYIYGSAPSPLPNDRCFSSKFSLKNWSRIFLISSSQKNESNKWRWGELNISSPRKVISRNSVFFQRFKCIIFWENFPTKKYFLEKNSQRRPASLGPAWTGCVQFPWKSSGGGSEVQPGEEQEETWGGRHITINAVWCYSVRIFPDSHQQILTSRSQSRN